MQNRKTLLLLLYVISCIALASAMIKGKQAKPNKKKTANTAVARYKKDSLANITYDSAVHYAQNLKNGFVATVKSIKNITNDETLHAASLLTDIVNLHLTPHWVGTPWDFNGVTQQPGKGQIACGYFVTTLLRDAGIKLNRVKLAQCASGKIISALVQKENHKNFSNLSFPAFINEIKKEGKGVFIVGLNFHTGFLLNDGKELFFVHSNYIERKGVVKEPAESSAALKASKWRSVGFLTKDKLFLGKWLNNTVF
jgi:hypothetical protein